METRIESVRIGDDEIAAVRGPDGEGYAVLRRMCEVLGINADNQREKLQRSEWATTVLISAVAEDGKNRELFCLHVKSVAMWLATIDANRVAESARPKIVKFQSEAADALYRWASGQQIETPEQKLLAGVLWLQQTVEEQKARLAIAEPKAAVHDEFLAGGESVTLRKAAQVLRQGQRDWNAELVETKYLYRDSADDLRPYQKLVDAKLFEVREVRCTDGRWRPTTLVTAAGIAHFARAYAQISMVLR